MRVCIIDTSTRPTTLSSVNVHEHNCRVLRKHFLELGWSVDLYYSDDNVDEKKQYDCILFSYGSFYLDFEKFERLFDAQKRCKIGWITNEYNLAPNSFVYKRISFIIKNFEQRRGEHPQICVNLNSLIARARNVPVRKVQRRHNVIYYGTYRPNREIYFQKYLHEPILLSSSAKNLKRFKAAGCTSMYIDKMSWLRGKETLNNFVYSLYIEDYETHENYNHLANRFYEALFCNVAPIFDVSCANTVKRSGYNVPDILWVDSLQKVRMIRDHASALSANIERFLAEATEQALHEKQQTLQSITEFVTRSCS